jgi:hypothetical protein
VAPLRSSFAPPLLERGRRGETWQGTGARDIALCVCVYVSCVCGGADVVSLAARAKGCWARFALPPPPPPRGEGGRIRLSCALHFSEEGL